MRRYTFALSIVVHVAVVGALMLSPIFVDATGDMRVHARRPLSFVQIDPAPLPSPPIAPPRASRARASASPAAAPVVAPDAIAPETGLETLANAPPAEGVPDGIPDGIPGALPIDGVLPSSPPPPPPAAPVRVGGSIRQPQKVREVAPVYPAIAQAARVQGVVILEAVIGEDGRVRNLRVLRSIPLLDQAAIDAVRQWQFTPTLLNGEPVPVVMTVTVAFQLRD